MKKTVSMKMVDGAVKFFAKNSANCTTSGTMYQPKAPEALKKFSKVNHAK